MSLCSYSLDNNGDLVETSVKGIARRVSENPVDYVILDAEEATLNGASDEEVKGLLMILQCTAEAQNLVHPKQYTIF